MGRSHWIAIQNPLPDESLSSRTTLPVLFSRRVVKLLRILMTNSTWELGVIRSGDSRRMPPVLTFFVQTWIVWTMSLLPNFTSAGQYKEKRGFPRRSGLAADTLIAGVTIVLRERMVYRLSDTVLRH
jgi:hypothetical protein